MSKIECVVFDWAGTTVDYGCFAPVAAFISAFTDLGIELTAREARGPMGMTKIDHIRELFRLERISGQFRVLFNREWTEADVVEMNHKFEGYLFASLQEYTDAIPGVFEMIEKLRHKGIKVGSTTGYTAKMMNIVAPAAAAKGYAPDCYVTSDGLPGGRPYPYMIYQNMINLAVASPKSIVKVGDTVADVREGVNAGVWSVGVVLGSSEMGLSEAETRAMDKKALAAEMQLVRDRFTDVGAHFVIDTMEELPALINHINTL
ncbi:MAG: phosphonoacetaldehyde hydrolase [Marinifilaceae bacterium]